jgi:hypothetical protein
MDSGVKTPENCCKNDCRWQIHVQNTRKIIVRENQASRTPPMLKKNDA